MGKDGSERSNRVTVMSEDAPVNTGADEPPVVRRSARRYGGFRTSCTAGRSPTAAAGLTICSTWCVTRMCWPRREGADRHGRSDP